jgi:cytochrome c553
MIAALTAGFLCCGPTVAQDSTPELAETAAEYIARRGEAPLRSVEMDGEAMGTVAVCAVCHGPQGGGSEALHAPRIGGLSEWYLARQLKYFRSGVRGAAEQDTLGTQMYAITLLLPADSSVEDLAAYLSTLEPDPIEAEVHGDAEHGKELYTVCSACHGTDGQGNPDLNTPTLVGQSPTYLVRQLENYKRGLRGSDPADLFGRQMQPIVETALTSQQDIQDVVSYITTFDAQSGSPANEASE